MDSVFHLYPGFVDLCSELLDGTGGIEGDAILPIQVAGRDAIIARIRQLTSSDDLDQLIVALSKDISRLIPDISEAAEQYFKDKSYSFDQIRELLVDTCRQQEQYFMAQYLLAIKVPTRRGLQEALNLLTSMYTLILGLAGYFASLVEYAKLSATLQT